MRGFGIFATEGGQKIPLEREPFLGKWLMNLPKIGPFAGFFGQAFEGRGRQPNREGGSGERPRAASAAFRDRMPKGRGTGAALGPGPRREAE